MDIKYPTKNSAMARTNTAVVPHSSHSSHRNKLKRTSYFLINLAAADLLISFAEPATIGTVGIPQRFGHEYYGMNQQHFKLYA